MNPPIQPGTARRLSLRPPEPTPTGILTVTRPQTSQQLQSIKDGWTKGLRIGPVVIRYPG